MHGLLGAGPPRVVQPAFLVSSVCPVSTSHEVPLVRSQSPHLVAHFETKHKNITLSAITNLLVMTTPSVFVTVAHQGEAELA